MDKQLEKSDLSVYSLALEKLLKSVLKVGSVIYSPIDNVYEYATKQTDDNLKLPFVSFYHQSTIDINWRGTNMPQYRRGKTYMHQTEEDSRFAITQQGMEVSIGYIFEVIAEDRDTAEELLKELLFFLLANQQVSIKYREKDLDMNFTLGDSIVDNTNLSNYRNEGRLYRFSFDLIVDAYLFRSQNYLNVITPVINIDIE